MDRYNTLIQIKPFLPECLCSYICDMSFEIEYHEKLNKVKDQIKDLVKIDYKQPIELVVVNDLLMYMNRTLKFVSRRKIIEEIDRLPRRKTKGTCVVSRLIKFLKTNDFNQICVFDTRIWISIKDLSDEKENENYKLFHQYRTYCDLPRKHWNVFCRPVICEEMKRIIEDCKNSVKMKKPKQTLIIL